MKTVVITGSSRGLGYGLAAEFLRRGCRVVVSGSSEESTAKAVEGLAATPDCEGKNILGKACDVREKSQLRALWQAAGEAFGSVDIWINNAGLGAYTVPFWEVQEVEVKDVVEVNVLGLMFGCQVAIEGMLEQGHGHIYNMEGFGSNDEKGNMLSTYGATKRGVRYLNHALHKELSKTPVKVSALYPGILPTDHNMRQKEHQSPEQWNRNRKFLNILGDEVATVTPWLVDRVLQNEQSGKLINWLTRGRVLMRFLTAGFNQREIFQ